MAWLFEQIEQGNWLTEQDFVVTRMEVLEYNRMVGNDAVSYDNEVPVPPTLTVPLAAFKAASPDKWPPGVLHAEQEFDFHRPLLADEHVTLQICVAEKYEKKQRRFVVLQTKFKDQSDSLVADTRSTLLWTG